MSAAAEFRADPVAFLDSLPVGASPLPLPFDAPAFFLSDPALLDTVLVANPGRYTKVLGFNPSRHGFVDRQMFSRDLDWSILRPAEVHAGGIRRALALLQRRWSAACAVDLNAEMRRLSFDFLVETFCPALREPREEVQAVLDEVIRRLDEVMLALPEMVLAMDEDAAAAFDTALAVVRAHVTTGDPLERARTITALLAGYEQIAALLTWMWVFIGADPQLSCAVEAEAATFAEPWHAPPSAYPHITSVLLETMRLYPPVWLMARRARECSTLGGVGIPRGAVVIMSQWVMHRAGSHFSEPLAFRPDRWRHGTIAPPFMFFPFSRGPHACLAASFIESQIVRIVATVTRSFAISCEGGFRAMRAGITLQPLGIVAARVQPVVSG